MIEAVRNSAIIFSPAGIPLGAAARCTLDHARRRLYRLVAVISEWHLIDQALASGEAQVVLFAGGDRDVELSNEPTHIISTATLLRSRQPPLTRERVREIIDCDATGPIGLDPVSIAAARRIAARLAEADAGGPSPSVQDRGCN